MLTLIFAPLLPVTITIGNRHLQTQELQKREFHMAHISGP
nr:MAG TPA: hypothetical protein [Caudoviricetes sp.]